MTLKAKFNKWGVLYIKRGNKWRKQYCPYNNKVCNDSCPQINEEKVAQNENNAETCNGNLLQIVIDERK